MRVAVTVEQAWHVVPGGIAISTAELLRALRTHEDIDLVGVAAMHRRPPPAAFAPPVPIRQLPLPRRVLYETWQRLRWPVVEEATGDVDVVHDAGYVVPPSRAPLVATIHDLLFLEFPDQYTWHSRAVLRRGLELARRHARLVMCPSKATIAACRDAGFEPERLREVPWGVHLRTPDPASIDGTRRRYGLHRRFVLFCGTQEPRKNLPRVLAAFRSLDRRELELVLVGPRGWKEDLRHDPAQASDAVRWLGFVPSEDLEAIYASAAVVLYPSLGEGFGLPVLEAMAQGAPVVTSRGTATEQVAGNAALLVDPTDTDAIAAATARFLDDQDLSRRVGRVAKQRAATYSWDRSAALAAGV